MSPHLVDKPLVKETEEEYDLNPSDSNPFGKAAENDKILATFFDISKYKLEYDNLNDCVTALLRKEKDNNAAARDIKRR